MSRVLAALVALLASSTFAQQTAFQFALEESTVAGISTTKHALTPGVLNLTEQLMKEGDIPGLSIGVVHSNDIVEVQSWGIRSEDGDVLTTDVGCRNS